MLRLTLFSLLTLFASGMAAYAQTAWPPAPFLLSPIGSSNPTLFRMDHVGGCMSNGLEQDLLELSWDNAYWKVPYEDRNALTDTIRYEINFILERPDGSGTFVVTLPSDNDGLQNAALLHGDVIYKLLFNPPDPHPEEPDSIVIRVPWFVRAWNRTGSTASDTAGTTIRNNPLPTPALVVSYNRPPRYTPSLIQPPDGAVITGISQNSPPVPILWSSSEDRNILKGQMIQAFRVYNPVTRRWEHDTSDRTVDTLTYQWVGTVVRTAPSGKGAPIGSKIIKNPRDTGLQLLTADMEMLFGGLTPPIAMTADTVVLDYEIWVKDFNSTDFSHRQFQQELVNFRFQSDGTLFPDTSQWSRFGCRPHDLVSSTYRITLVRDGIVGVERSGITTPPDFSLGQGYPNPFSTTTSVNYTLSRTAQVQIDICDALGRSIKVLTETVETPGVHQVNWDGTDHTGHPMPAGVYLVRLRGGGNVQTRSVTLLR